MICVGYYCRQDWWGEELQVGCYWFVVGGGGLWVGVIFEWVVVVVGGVGEWLLLGAVLVEL